MADRNTSTRDKSAEMETNIAYEHPLVSWRSILGGLIVALLSIVTLMALGMAFGGVGLSDETSLQSAGIFTGVWFLISALVSLFLGGYFAARISKFQTSRIGSAQGVIIAGLFFGIFLWQTVAALGWAGKSAGAVVGTTVAAAGAGATQMASSSMVNDIVEDALGDLTLQSDVKVVVTGVSSRILRGDVESAKNYLARQAGITPLEADQKIQQLRSQADQALIQARGGAAAALKATGWMLFLTLVLGVGASALGGAMGSRANFLKPLSREQVDPLASYAASSTPVS